jgi:hypothetical protein
MLRAVGYALVAAAIMLAAVGCGGKANSSRQVSTLKVNPIGNVTPPPLLPKNVRADPDALPEGGADATWSILTVGNGVYSVDLQNTSRIGFIDAIKWTPPRGTKVLQVLKSSVGSCRASAGAISCTGLRLKPPKCACGVGGHVVVTFRMTGVKERVGFMSSALEVDQMTPVPWIIPSSLGKPVSALADEPVCKPNEISTQKHPCQPG